MTSPYDSFAWFYNRYWAAPFHEWQMPALERLLLRKLLPGAHILDLCCGTGHLARHLLARGFRVTGVDASAGMLEHARENAPGARLVHAQAHEWQPMEPLDAAVSTFDSLNHILEPRLLRQTFANVHRALKPGGSALFDINTDEAYGPEWDGSAAEVREDHAFFLRGRYDAAARRGTTEVTMFRLSPEGWQRDDVAVSQRPWSIPEIESLLEPAGFPRFHAFRASEDLHLPGHFGQGRVYVSACKAHCFPAAS